MTDTGERQGRVRLGFLWAPIMTALIGCGYGLTMVKVIASDELAALEERVTRYREASRRDAGYGEELRALEAKIASQRWFWPDTMSVSEIELAIYREVAGDERARAHIAPAGELVALSETGLRELTFDLRIVGLTDAVLSSVQALETSLPRLFIREASFEHECPRSSAEGCSGGELSAHLRVQAYLRSTRAS